MIPLAARRGGGLTWEYYFQFDGGPPPWTSAMSQATGLEALTRAYQATGERYYLQLAAPGAAVFGTQPPPVGVIVPTPLGVRFLQYTFTPRDLDHQRVSADADRPLRLRAGERQHHRAERCSRPATPRRWPSCRASTPAPGRCTSRASRTT